MTQSDSGQYRLRVIGAPDLQAPDGHRVTSVLSQPSRLSLLTYLALAPGPVSRSSVVADFWPESDEDQARNNLSQAVFYLRRSLDEDVVRSVEGDRLWAPPERLWCDAREVLEREASPTALHAAPHTAPHDEAAGELLAGWNAEDSQPLQEWLDGQRRRVSDRLAVVRPAAGPGAPPAAGGGGETPPPTDVSPAEGPQAIRPGQPGSTVESPAGEAAPLRRAGAPSAWAAGGGAVALVVTLALGAVWLGRPAPAAEPSGAPRALAVLMPRVTAAPDAPAIGRQGILAEVLAELARAAGLRVVEASYASTVDELRRLLPRLAAEDRDVADLILAIEVRIASDQSRVVGLLYTGERFEVVGRAAFDVPHGTPDAVLIEAPLEIATGVAGMVANALVTVPE